MSEETEAEKQPIRFDQRQLAEFQSVGPDVSERKKLEYARHYQADLLQKTIDSMTDAVFILDAKSSPPDDTRM